MNFSDHSIENIILKCNLLRKKIDWKIIILTLVCYFILSACAVASQRDNCLINKYEGYSKIKESWQRDFQELVVQKEPALEDVSQLYMNHQLILIEKSLLAIKLLLKFSPNLINPEKEINRWFSLNKDVEILLANKSPKYKKLYELKLQYRNRAPHPDGDKLRAVVLSDIMPLSNYKTMYSNFVSQIDGINKQKCT